MAIWVAVLIVIAVGECGDAARHCSSRGPRAVMTARRIRAAAETPQLLPPSPGAGNDFQKDLQFRKLNAVKDIIEIKVVRGGEVKVRRARARLS